MAAPLRLAGFAGANPYPHPMLLPAEVGVDSRNQRPGRGNLRPWKQPLTVAAASTSARKTLYRFGRDNPSDTAYWFEWSTVVHAVRGFIADDAAERTYFTGAGTPKVTDSTMGLSGAPLPTSSRELGVPAPITAPVLLQTAEGTGTDEDRYYVYAYITDHGELSGPSPVSARVTCKPGATFNIANLAAPPAGNYGIDRIRIYRTVTGATGAAEFFFLREIAVASTSTDDARAVGTDTLESNGPAGTLGRVWSPPPSNLKWLTALWGSMMAGISGKSVRFCEPGKPYAWPAAYEVLCDDTPVALVAFDKSLLVLTTGAPVLIYGSTPEAMDSAIVPLLAPCVSERSVVNFRAGACWATPDGLAYAGADGLPRLLTRDVLAREDWQALVPSSLIATQYNGLYVGFYDAGAGRKGFVFNPLAPTALYWLDTGYTAAYYDPIAAQLYVLDGTAIRKWDAGAAPMTVTFRSKVFRVPQPTNFGWAEVVADAYPVTLKVYGDGVLRFTKTVTSLAPFALPSGFLSDAWQLEVTSSNPVTAIALAEQVADLQQL